MEILFSRKVAETQVKVISGDITDEDTEAIVNAANPQLSHGGGVALAISMKGGPVIQEQSRNLIKERGPVKTGCAVYTLGGKLKSKYVIHTVGPVWGEGDEEEKLAKAIISSLELATTLGVKSISFPAISCGIYGFPPDRGTKIIVNTIEKFIAEHPSAFQEVHLVGLGKEIPSLFRKALSNEG